MLELQAAEGLGQSLGHGGTVGGEELVVQGHPGSGDIAVGVLHDLLSPLEGGLEPGAGGSAAHDALPDLVHGGVHHSQGHGNGNGLGTPDALVAVADLGVDAGQFLGLLGITGAVDADGAGTHGGAVGHVVGVEAARIGGTDAAAQVIAGLHLADAAALELILGGNVLQPCLHHVLGGEVALGVDDGLGHHQGKLGIVGGPGSALIEVSGKAVVPLVFGHAAGVAQGIADGETGQGSPDLIGQQLGIGKQFFSCDHFSYLVIEIAFCCVTLRSTDFMVTGHHPMPCNR